MFQQQPQPATGRAHTERQTITRDELREWINDFIQRDHNPTVADAITELQNTFLRPTLEELIDQGNDPDDYQWMQANHENTDELVIITRAFKDRWAHVLWGDGAPGRSLHSDLTPRPDLPRFEWPAPEVAS